MNWKPIETAPKDGTEILIATKYSAGWAVNDAYWSPSRRCWTDGFCENCECPNEYERPTLWTEFPNPDRPDDGDSRLLRGALLLLKEAGVMPSSTELIEAAERAERGEELPAPSLVSRYREVEKKLDAFRKAEFPTGLEVYVACDRYTGFGVSAGAGSTGADHLDVLLGNGNIWSYPIETVRPVRPDEALPQWIQNRR